jgi:hypothetical protein
MKALGRRDPREGLLISNGPQKQSARSGRTEPWNPLLGVALREWTLESAENETSS